MITYPNGDDVRVGDRVDYDGVPAIVKYIVDDQISQEHWGVEQDGVMFDTEDMGLVFHPINDLCWDCTIVLIMRGNATEAGE
ncbi:hypothetical protein HED60_18525 [Planctomycetales bacterium ZRK34]|nr:hypothetical protein HED60_18525 [Planctomycetales bacterium ZRK34]